MLRIEALALMAIVLSFFVAAFGSCRRRSNSWIVQKGFLAANALFLSLGTYSIGLMQSSTVKSEMYPVWSVSLFTLLGCVDSITTYSLDNKSMLWKMLYQLFLYCGYVLLISISSMSSSVGNIAIGVLSTVTFMKGFHRSLALVLPSKLQDMIRLVGDFDTMFRLFEDCWVVHWPLDKIEAPTRPSPNQTTQYDDDIITMGSIWSSIGRDRWSDECLALYLSHLLQRRFFGLDCVIRGAGMPLNSVLEDAVHGLERVFKVIDVELGFLFDVFFTSNAFLHYYESRAATIGALASVIGICFVGVVSVIPGTRATRTSGGTTVLETTMADLTVTLIILLSLVSLQVLQLIHCWTSNWAKVAFVCDSVRNKGQLTCWMRLRLWILTTTDGNSPLWQNKLGQYSLVESISTRECKLLRSLRSCLYKIYSPISRMFAMQYIEQVLGEMWGVKTGNPVELHPDVKRAIFGFHKERGGRLWSETFCTWHLNGLWSHGMTFIAYDDHIVTIMIWHVATCYCEQAVRKEDFRVEDDENERLMATTLSKYCAYLVVSLPRLLSGNHLNARSVFNQVEKEARISLQGAKDKLEAMRRLDVEWDHGVSIFKKGVALGKELESWPNRWKVLAEFWVAALLYAAPSENAQEHMARLAQGGEFITHLWALLSHDGIMKQPTYP